MSLHTARVAPEKLTPHQPAAVQFVRISNEVDMVEKREFIVGDCGSVEILPTQEIVLNFLPYMVEIDGIEISNLSANAQIVEVAPLTAEQAYLIGKALLMAAKLQGISE